MTSLSRRQITVARAVDMNVGLVFNLTPNLDEVAEAYAVVDERRAIKSLLHVGVSCRRGRIHWRWAPCSGILRT
jgi:hypothetical protein